MFLAHHRDITPSPTAIRGTAVPLRLFAHQTRKKQPKNENRLHTQEERKNWLVSRLLRLLQADILVN